MFVYPLVRTCVELCVWRRVLMCMFFCAFWGCVCRRAVSFSLVVSIIRSLLFFLQSFQILPFAFYPADPSHFPSLTHFHLHPCEWWTSSQSFILAQWWTGRNPIFSPPFEEFNIVFSLDAIENWANFWALKAFHNVTCPLFNFVKVYVWHSPEDYIMRAEYPI